MLYPDTDIQYVKGVGEKRAVLFRRLGISCVHDLIHFYPRAYRDLNSVSLISEAPLNENCCIRAIADHTPEEFMIRKGMSLFKTFATDGRDILHITIFNNRYAAKSIEEGKEYIFCGKLTHTHGYYEMSSPVIEPAEDDGEIKPVYPQTAGLTSRVISRVVRNALAVYEPDYDVIPASIREKYKLCTLGYALSNVHFPKSQQDIDISRRRLMFEELLVLQLGMAKMKNRDRGYTENIIRTDYTDEFASFLPYRLTAAQINAIADAVRDMGIHRPMNRLLQGDVGSGKTCVAAAIIYTAVKNGMQCALMAPTSILAGQHYKSFSSFFENTGISFALLTSATPAKEKREIKRRLSEGEIQLLIGTHAVIQKDVVFKNLGLVITDEQHRFGVNQRSELSSKGENPHTFVMSATPIPRTLALMIYGDLDLSVLDELPAGRQKTDTYVVDGSYRRRIYNYIRSFIDKGFQGYIVCPLIDSDEDSEMTGATEYVENLRKDPAFEGCSIGLLHGKMKPKEKDAVMEDFVRGKIRLLVSTTVIEVGVDVPNAVIMVIENADRFGLSQLHQLRGRIGRGNTKSDCILITSSDSDASAKRLEIMKKTCDGFKIADEDLRLRGPGDFFGQKQHGLPEVRIADMLEDMVLCKQSQSAVKEIIDSDPLLEKEENQPLNREIKSLFKDKYNMN